MFVCLQPIVLCVHVFFVVVCTLCLSICYCFCYCRGCSGVGCSLLRGAWQSGGETEETGGSRSTTLLPVFLFLCLCLIVLSFYIVVLAVFLFLSLHLILLLFSFYNLIV